MLYMGIDMGGTSTKAGIVEENGRILCKKSCETKIKQGYKTIFADMVFLAGQIIMDSGCNKEEIASVGIGFPGIIDPQTGEVPFCSNLNWPDRLPMARLLTGMMGKPVYVCNDAGAAALAEWKAGASKGSESSVMVTLGTGVGGGVILNGRIFTGSHGTATEFGHMITVEGGELCSCGNRGCWECYASATALSRAGRELCRKNPDTGLLKAVDQDPGKIEARTVIDLAKSGDRDCEALFERYVGHLSTGIINLINLYDPEVIVIGGGVSHAGTFLLDRLRKKVQSMLFFKSMPPTRIELAKLGNDAGIIGASMLGMR